MSVCNVQDLISANPCLSELSPRQLKVVKLAMLCGIKNFLTDATPVTCDIQELLSDSACFYALNPDTMDVLEAQLICDIANLM